MIKQALHIVLSLILYISTAGISIHSHYCKNELKSVSLLVEAASCHSTKKSCPHHPPSEEEKKDCCDNQLAFEKYDSDVLSMNPDQIQDVKLHPPFVDPYNHHSQYNTPELLLDQRYRPPPATTPIYIRFQSILC